MYTKSIYTYSIFHKLVRYKNMIDDIIEIDQYLLRHKKCTAAKFVKILKLLLKQTSTLNEV